MNIFFQYRALSEWTLEVCTYSQPLRCRSSPKKASCNLLPSQASAKVTKNRSHSRHTRSQRLPALSYLLARPLSSSRSPSPGCQRTLYPILACPRSVDPPICSSSCLPFVLAAAEATSALGSCDHHLEGQPCTLHHVARNGPRLKGGWRR